jgi:hypothetical protein
MTIYAKALFVGLCAAAVVLGVCWSAGLFPSVVYRAPPPSRPTPVVPTGDEISVTTTVELGDTTVTRMPGYVVALAGVTLITASGWQLRRSWRERKGGA